MSRLRILLAAMAWTIAVPAMATDAPIAKAPRPEVRNGKTR